MKILVQSTFGSRLYGTNLPDSDTDYKQVFIPDYEDMITGKALDVSTKKELTETSKTEYESFPIAKYAGLLKSGNSIALEVLFTPKDLLVISSKEWEELYEHRHNLISNNFASFVGYCKEQAYKYGVKGTKFKTIEKIRDIFYGYPLNKSDKMTKGLVSEILAQGFEGVSIVTKGNNTYLHILGKMIDINRPYDECGVVLNSIYNNYGDRSKTASDGSDWKALYHSIRVAKQAVELLTENTLTFPRPEVDLLMDIRLGKKSKEEVSELINSLLTEVETLALQKKQEENKFDSDFLHDWVMRSCKKYHGVTL